MNAQSKIHTKPTRGEGKARRLMPARAMYIATLQAVKPDSHPELVKGKGKGSKLDNICLVNPRQVSLLCVLLWSMREILACKLQYWMQQNPQFHFIAMIFGFVCMKPTEIGKYVPMMLHLRSFCPSIPLMSRGRSSVSNITRFPCKGRSIENKNERRRQQEDSATARIVLHLGKNKTPNIDI